MASLENSAGSVSGKSNSTFAIAVGSQRTSASTKFYMLGVCETESDPSRSGRETLGEGGGRTWRTERNEAK